VEKGALHLEGDMEEYEVDLRDYFHVLWKQKWIVIVTFVVAVVTALGISYSLPKVYETRISLLIQAPLAEEVGGEVTGTVFAPETYKQLAIAPDLFQEIANDLGTPGLPGSVSVEVEKTTAVGFPGRFPLFLRATWTGNDPEILPVLAETWARRFTEKNAQLFSSQTAQSYDYVKQNFDQAQEELLAQEDARDQYKTENSLEILQAEVSVLQDDYQSYFDQLREKRKRLATVEAAIAALQETITEKPEYLVLERSISSEALWNFLAQGAGVEELSAIPALRLEDQQFNSVYLYLKAQLATNEVSGRVLREDVSYLESALETTQTALQTKRVYLIEVQTELERFAREISISKGFYSSLASRLQEAKIALAETAAAIRIIESPVMPTSPIGPNKKMNVAVAGVLGLFVGVLLAFFVHWLFYAEKREEMGKPLPPAHGEHSN